jgi:hypothetical protein
MSTIRLATVSNAEARQRQLEKLQFRGRLNRPGKAELAELQAGHGPAAGRLARKQALGSLSPTEASRLKELQTPIQRSVEALLAKENAGQLTDPKDRDDYRQLAARANELALLDESGKLVSPRDRDEMKQLEPILARERAAGWRPAVLGRWGHF